MLKVITPRIFPDSRGKFFELYKEPSFTAELGKSVSFVQDNVSVSSKGVVRGLHFQNPNQQGKLVTVLSGAIFDVAVDVRIGSPDFGAYVYEILDSTTHRQFFIPAGYAHGFQALEDNTVVLYKCTDVYHPDSENTILYNDPRIHVKWPLAEILVSEKDLNGYLLKDFPMERLPLYNA